MLKYITPPYSNGWARRYVSISVRRVYSHVPIFLCTELSTWLGYPSSHGFTGSIESTTTWMSSLSNRNADNTRSVTLSRIWQNPMTWQNLAEFYGLAELSRIWQKRQIAVDCGKLRSHTQSPLAKSVEIGSGVSRVCFIILHWLR